MSGLLKDKFPPFFWLGFIVFALSLVGIYGLSLLVFSFNPHLEGGMVKVALMLLVSPLLIGALRLMIPSDEARRAQIQRKAEMTSGLSSHPESRD